MIYLPYCYNKNRDCKFEYFLKNKRSCMSDVIKLRKGLNIRLKGKPEQRFFPSDPASLHAVKPPDFYGLVPRLVVQPGDSVKAGTPLFFDKSNPDIVFVSPVSGKVNAVRRGERRAILEVVVEASGNQEYESFATGDPLTMGREQIINQLLKAGCWPFIRQRPYGIIANPADTPKSVFVSGFDTAPLAPDYTFVLKESQQEFQTGLNALSKLSPGGVYLNVPDPLPEDSFYRKIVNARITRFRGPHPAGNVGIQIHHLDPINKGDIVWYVNPQDVVILGRLFLTGRFDATRTVAVTGSEILKPGYYRTMLGASIKPLVEKNVQEGEKRYISGNVLTGSRIGQEGYIGFYDSQITVIPEGKHFEFLGWALPGWNKFSMSRSYFSWLQPGREYRIDTNLNGGRRAYVMTGQYEKVLPMDIYPVHLVKAIIIEDVDLMEKLGIYEVSEEDFALCEFVCTSKTEVQQIIRKGLDLIRKEMS